MGNYASCALSGPHSGHPGATKVVFPSGEIRHFDGAVNAAEIMLDAPNHFLADARALQIGKRFPPLAAEEELERGEVYVLFSMDRVSSVATAADMGALWVAASAEARRVSGGGARVLPEAAPPPPEPLGWPFGLRQKRKAPRLMAPADAEGGASEFAHRLSASRSRRPKLETIAEEPICSR